jgi:Tfp pilus assembly protein FimT
MSQDGFSLTEMLVIICLIAILLALGTVRFGDWTTKNKIETQFKAMYADILGARSQSLYRKRGRSVTFTTTGYSMYSTNNTIVAPLKQITLKVPVTTVPNPLTIDFDQMGVAFNNATSTRFICVQSNSSKAVNNSIILSATRIQMGSLSGSGCSSANVKPQ